MTSIALTTPAAAPTILTVTDQMTEIYVFVDDYLKAHPAQAHWRRSNNAAPALTDAEVITVALMQGVFGCATLKRAFLLVTATLKRAFLLVASDWRMAFPHLCGYRQWVARLHRLAALVGALIQAAAGRCPSGGTLYLMDAKPLPVCKPLRHGRVRLLHEDGAHFSRGNTGWYFGFKLHALAHHGGAILSAVLTPANWSEADANWSEADAALALGLCVGGGTVIADLGYRKRGGALWQTLADEAGLVLVHPADGGRRGEPRAALLSGLRGRIETAFSGLWARFVDRVLSRSWQGLWSTVKLKMLHYNLCLAGLLPG